jgi:hypothetical protein
MVFPLLDRIPRSGQAPFQATFAGVAIPEAASVEVVSYQPDRRRSVPLEARIEAYTTGVSGRIDAIGRLENSTDQPAAVRSVAVWALDAAGEPAALGPSVAGLSVVMPGASVPFRAELTAWSSPIGFEVYVDATRAAEAVPPPVSTGQTLELRRTAQGRPFVVGEATNAGDQPWRVNLVVTLLREGKVVGLSELSFPLPLLPGRAQPFATAELGGLAGLLDSEQDGQLELEAMADPLLSGPTDVQLVPLDMSVQRYEAIGSSLFLEGVVSNPGAAPVDRPAVLAAVWSSEGRLLTAGWALLGSPIDPGASAPFSVKMSLPGGVDLTVFEYDVEAVGISAP